MIIDLTPQIESITNLEDVKAILKVLQSSLNKLDDARTQAREDVKFLNAAKGVVLKAPDGNYWRATLTLNGTTAVPEWTFTNAGKV